MGVAMAIGQLVVPAGIHRLTTTGSEALTVLAVVGIGLPVLTYTLLTAIWLMKLLRNGLGGAHRL
jgi:predicted Kef-type K+ transport protein